MGLFDDIFKGTGDPQRDAVINQGLLSAGLALMQSRGKFLPALGAAGAQGMQASMALRQQQRQNGMQDWKFGREKKQAEREDALAALPNRFMMPGGDPAIDVIGGMDTAVEAPNNVARPQGFDANGWLNARMGIDPEGTLALKAKGQPDSPFAKVNPADYTPASVQAFLATGNHATLVPVRKKEFVNGQAVDPYATPPGTVLDTNDPNRPFALKGGVPQPNTAFQNYEIGKAKAGAASMSQYSTSPTAGTDPRTGLPTFAVLDKQGNVKLLDSFAPPTPKLGEKQVNQLAGIDALGSAVDSYVEALSGWKKTDALSPDKRAGIGTAYNNMMLQAKEAFNLGVLNGPDYTILQAVVRDPTNLMSAVTSNEALTKQATDLKALMQKTRDAVAGAKATPRAPTAPAKSITRVTTGMGRLTAAERAEMDAIKALLAGEK